MNRIVFLPRAVAARWKPVPGSVLISIHDHAEEPLQPQEGWTDVVWLRFDDTDNPNIGLEVFSTSQAEQVLAFAEKHRNAAELVVHCQMGHSRSAGVAIFLSEHLGLPCFKEQRQVTAMTWQGYNKLVYRTLSDVVHGPIGSAFASQDP
jgi:predicted protein tyrosine phosphatase